MSTEMIYNASLLSVLFLRAMSQANALVFIEVFDCVFPLKCDVTFTSTGIESREYVSIYSRGQ